MRIEPKLPSESMKTYQIVAPPATHFRAATCVEAGCKHYREGWVSVIDEGNDIGRAQAHYIRNQSGRHFKEDRNQAPGFTCFVFEPGQVCFKADQHKVRLDKPEIFLVRDGDFRGNPRGTAARVHTNADDWVDDFGNHQLMLADQIKQG